MAQWPRQPRSGCAANEADYVASGSRYYVRLKNSSGTFTNAFSVNTQARANTVAQRLNELFDEDGADLDFITPGYANGYYVVLWSRTCWFRDNSFSDYSTNHGTTYENLYAGCVKPKANGTYYAYANEEPLIIATVTSADTNYYGTDAWEIALTWANAIRNLVNGWNCSKDSTGTLLNSGYIYKLKVPTASYSGNRTLSATYYGAGELQPNFTTANNDFFHTCDLTVARPKGTTYLALNSFVRVTYGTKSVVARVTDTCGTSNLDLSCGLANALGFTSGSVTISAP